MKKNSKKTKRRLMISLPLTLFIIVFSFITTTKELIKINNLSNQKHKLSGELNNLKEESESLNTEITKLNDPIYIARYAREKYLYSKDGEIVVILDSDKAEEENTNIVDNSRLFTGIGVFALAITSIFIFILRKKEIKKAPK